MILRSRRSPIVNYLCLIIIDNCPVIFVRFWAVDESDKKALEIFPKLYYFIPVSARRRLKLGENEIRITETDQAILWFIELLIKESEASLCYQSQVQSLLRWWYPEANFARSLRHLVRAGYIRQILSEPDLRRKLLELTSQGKSVLDDLKAERLAFIRILIDALPQTQQAIVLSALENLSALAWKNLKEEVSINRWMPQ
jgi:DNA-binding MarR family transcriptional regulator